MLANDRKEWEGSFHQQSPRSNASPNDSKKSYSGSKKSQTTSKSKKSKLFWGNYREEFEPELKQDLEAIKECLESDDDHKLDKVMQMKKDFFNIGNDVD